MHLRNDYNPGQFSNFRESLMNKNNSIVNGSFLQEHYSPNRESVAYRGASFVNDQDEQ